MLLVGPFSAAAQNWRPFRPNGDVHAFALSRNGATTDSILTLRLDSAGVRDADSVYFFNRIMWSAKSTNPGERWRKSRNNQFGARLRYEAATKVYWLEWAADAGERTRSIPLPIVSGAPGAAGKSARAVTVTACELTCQ